MSAIDWVCKKISLESASGQLLAITISRQQVLPSKLDACANVTTCCWFSRPASMTSRLASVTFKMASKVFFEETDKNFEFITSILFRFLGFGDFKMPIVKEY